jgi:hypothetical protein
VLDALMFEERGIPGIALVTEPFRQTATAMATTWGLPGFKFLCLPHPIANLADTDLDERADRLGALVLDLVAGRGGAPPAGSRLARDPDRLI